MDFQQWAGQLSIEEWGTHDVQVVDAHYVRDYTIWLRFADGVEGEVDLSDFVERYDSDAHPLRDIEYFKNFRIDWSIEWSGGWDIAPESLHVRALGLYQPRIIASL